MIKAADRQPPGPHRSSRLAGVARSLLQRRAMPETGFAPLIDAKAAGRLLGVPHTWLLAQAREGRIPHHRLGHYVRFDAQELRVWLHERRPANGRAPGALRP
jgi:excisionase family DNA binding protein